MVTADSSPTDMSYPSPSSYLDQARAIASEIRTIELTLSDAAVLADAAAEKVREEIDVVLFAVGPQLNDIQAEIARLQKKAADLTEPYADRLEDIEARAEAASDAELLKAKDLAKTLPAKKEALGALLGSAYKETGLKTFDDLQLRQTKQIEIADQSRAFECLQSTVKPDSLPKYIQVTKAGCDYVAAAVAIDKGDEEQINTELAKDFPGFTLKVTNIPVLLKPKAEDAANSQPPTANATQEQSSAANTREGGGHVNAEAGKTESMLIQDSALLSQSSTAAMPVTNSAQSQDQEARAAVESQRPVIICTYCGENPAEGLNHAFDDPSCSRCAVQPLKPFPAQEVA